MSDQLSTKKEQDEATFQLPLAAPVAGAPFLPIGAQPLIDRGTHGASSPLDSLIWRVIALSPRRRPPARKHLLFPFHVPILLTGPASHEAIGC